MEKIKVIRRELEVDRSNCARVIPISCLHIGHRNYLEDKAKAFLQYVLKTKGTYAMMLGDTVENVTSGTASRILGTIHDQVMSVEEQRDEAIRLLKPLAKAGKILAWTESNHSLRSWKESGFSPEKYICKELDQVWCGFDALLNLKVGKNKYRIHATHGTGGGCATSSVAKKLQDQATRIDSCDVYLRGHHHRKLITERMRINGVSGEIRKQLMVATGCFMGYLEGYGHQKELSPTVPGCAKVKLYAGDWDVHCTL